jgi:hypothetical protein
MGETLADAMRYLRDGWSVGHRSGGCCSRRERPRARRSPGATGCHSPAASGVVTHLSRGAGVSMLVVSGTGTGVGKTVVTAAIAAFAVGR